MLMTVSQEGLDQLVEALREDSIEVAVIGEMTAKDVYLERRGRLSYVTPPDSDELYKVVF